MSKKESTSKKNKLNILKEKYCHLDFIFSEGNSETESIKQTEKANIGQLINLKRVRLKLGPRLRLRLKRRKTRMVN